MAQLKDSLISGDLRVTGTIYGDVPLNDLVDADDLKAIEALSGTSGILKKTAANTWTLDTNAYTTTSGTVTSVRVQATSPVVSSINTAQSSTLNTTISLADNYGDTKNPYASKTARYVLAAPASAAGAPSFRALTKADISDFSHTHGNLTNDGKVGTDENKAVYTGTGGAITAGTLPVAAGGTGATSVVAMRSVIEDGNYLSCTTGASTAAKTISLTGFALKTGMIVNVIFTVQNTAASPTLNINSTGAKSIYCKGVQVKSYGLKANTIYRLLYDGTYWQVVNEITPAIGSCGTSVGTVAKTANIAGFVPYVGATVYIKFTNNNSALAPTLNINGYGAKAIRNKGKTSGTMYYPFRTDEYYGFVYNGTEYTLINHVIQEATTLGVTAVAEQTDPDTGDVITPAVTAVHGTDTLYLGNPTNSTTNNGLTGKLQLYNASTGSVIISAEVNTSTSNRTWYLPNVNSNRYFITHSAATALGSNTKPIKIDANGVVAEASTYAGGTKVTLNNSDKGATTASFYAPTAGGTSGQFLVAAGSTSAPNWKTLGSHSYTPAGTVSVSTNTSTNKTATVSAASSGTVTYTPGGTNSAPTFNGTAATIVVSGGSGTATYTPAGTIAVNTAGSTVAADDITAWTTNVPTAVTKKTVVTSATVSDEILTISTGDSVTVTNGTAASLSYTARTVKSGDASYKFTGTGTRLTASYTPAGSVTAPTFTGTGVRLVTGNIEVPSTYTATFNGTAATLSHSVS